MSKGRGRTIGPRIRTCQSGGENESFSGSSHPDGFVGNVEAALREQLLHYRVHSGSTTMGGDDVRRSRVWQAEQRLADYLLSRDILSGEELKWVKRSRALVRLKQMIRRRHIRLSGGHENHDGSILRDLPHLPLALLVWRVWRARLSGY